jgi:flagellar protein FlaG
MFGNLTSVTAEPARTSVPSVPTDAKAPVDKPVVVAGNSPVGGRDLPVPKPKTLDVAKAVERLNELSSGSRRNLRFRVDESSGRTIITVINAVTKEIIRQIPSEELLAIAATLEQSGGMIDALV